MMRGFVVVCAAWIVFQNVQVSPPLAHGSGSPRLILEEKSHDFGRVQEGDVVEHTFRIFNKGDGPLLIGRVKPG
jgi:hypothetical protein